MKILEKLLPVLLFSLLLLLTGCGEQEDTFTVGFDANFPPYGFKAADGTYTGFDLELAEEVAKRNGWKLVKKPIEWNAKDMELKNGSIDCIWNGFTINGRENDYEWSAPYVSNKQVVLVLADSPVRTLADLSGKAVAVQTDTPVKKELEQGGSRAELGKTFRNLVVTPNYNNAVMELEAGSVDAVAMDIGVANAKMAAGKFRILDEALMSEEYGIGFLKGNTALRDKVQKTLNGMVKDGTAAKISRKYFDGKEVYGEMQTGIRLFDMVKQLGSGLLVSVEIFVLTLVFALPLGLLIALGRMSENIIVRNIFRIYISVMRGTPLMLQLFVWFFGPYYLFGIRLGDLSFCGIDYRFTAVIIGFSLNYAAYFAEIYRGGIDSIAKGQYEAAAVLGYTKCSTFLRIILPQVIKRIIPPVTNEVITLVKDTSLAFSLSVLEMFTIAKEISSANTTMMPFVIAGLFYYIFNFLVAGAMGLLEKKLDYYKG